LPEELNKSSVKMKLKIFTFFPKFQTVKIELTLILLSAILLGIWLLPGTIGLRNILLVLMGPISLIYCWRKLRVNSVKISLINWMPIAGIGGLFFWVLIHYFWFSRYPELQLHELKTTWLRSLLATIIGFGVGLSVRSRPNAIFLLWIVLLLSFIYLICQFLVRELPANSGILHVYKDLLYPGKISGVMAGVILIAGMFGSVVDRYESFSMNAKYVASLLFVGTYILVLYCFVYIFNARNGVGIVFFESVFFLAYFFLVALYSSLKTKKYVKSSAFNMAHRLAIISLATTLTVALSFFVYQHIKNNQDLLNFDQDISASIQIEKFENWKNPQLLGYPLNQSGQLVRHNTYERISWATAGIKIFIPENPLGIGILKEPFGTLMRLKYPGEVGDINSTHSGWVDIALSFGLPGIGLLLVIFIGVVLMLINSNSPFKNLSLILLSSLSVLYLVGEVSNKHYIEILFYLLALISGMLFPISRISEFSKI